MSQSTALPDSKTIIILYDDVKTCRDSKIRDLFCNGRHYAMSFITTKQCIKLFPGYEYCPQCSLNCNRFDTYDDAKHSTVFQHPTPVCGTCNGMGQIPIKMLPKD